MERDAAAEYDPLYDPPLLIFVYTAWAATSWLAGRWPGLVALVGATALLVAAGARAGPVTAAPRSFVADLATILLFCAASLAVGVGAVTALGRWPELTIATVALSTSLAVLVALTTDLIAEAPDRG